MPPTVIVQPPAGVNWTLMLSFPSSPLFEFSEDCPHEKRKSDNMGIKNLIEVFIVVILISKNEAFTKGSKA